jgi:hypothetical protein
MKPGQIIQRKIQNKMKFTWQTAKGTKILWDCRKKWTYHVDGMQKGIFTIFLVKHIATEINSKNDC